MAQLPTLPQPIDSLTLKDLRILVPELVKLCSKKQAKGRYDKSLRPPWWPKKVPWTNPRCDPRTVKKVPWSLLLRKIVRSCYKYHDKVHMLKGPGGKKTLAPSSRKTINSPPKKTSNSGSCPAMSNTASPNITPVKVGNHRTDQSSFTPIWNGWSSNSSPYGVKSLPGNGSPRLAIPGMGPIPRYGPFPAELLHAWKTNNWVPSAAQFPTRKPVVAALPTAEASTAEGAIPTEKAFVEVFICFFCEKDFQDRLYLQRHQEECPKRPSRLQASQMPLYFVPTQNLPRRNCYRIPVSQYKRPEKGMFVKGLDLLPTRQAEALKHQKNQEVDCIIIDLDETPVPKTPATPRTPKSLISQLSRDTSPPPVSRKQVFDLTDDKDTQGSDAESVCSRSDVGDEVHNQQKAASLLNIDLCSPLGLRVKENLMVNVKTADKKESPEDSPGHDEFCRTPVKNMFLDRLRNRQNSYPITFRVFKHRRKHTHDYKFTKKDIKNFILRLDTGLSAQSRKLKKSMQKCSVVLHNMSVEEITRYVMFTRTKLSIPKKMVSNNALLQLLTRPVIDAEQPPIVPIFPEGPSILDNYDVLRQVLGLKTREEHRARPVLYNKQLSLSQMVSEQVNAEVMQQKAVVYKTVLADCDGNRVELTPPSTPTKSPASERMSLFEAFSPSKNMCTSSSVSPFSSAKRFYQGANTLLNGRHHGSSSHPHSNVTTNGQVVYGGKESRTASPVCDKMEDLPRARTPSAMAVLNSLSHRPSGESPKCWNQSPQESPVTQEKPAPSRRQSRRSSTGSNSPSLPIAPKRRNSRTSVASDDVISISDSDGEDSVRVTRSKRSLTPDILGNANKRRKLSQEQGVVSGSNHNATSMPPSRPPQQDGKKTPTVLFKCHLCHSEIAFRRGASDFIMQHFQQKHGVYNLHLVENTDQHGNSVVTIVEDTSRPRHMSPSPLNPVPSSPAMSGLSLQRHVPITGSMQPNNLPMSVPGFGNTLNRSPLARPPVSNNSSKQAVELPLRQVPGNVPAVQVMQKLSTVGPGCFPLHRQLNMIPSPVTLDVSKEKTLSVNSNIRPRTRRTSKDMTDIADRDGAGKRRRSSRLGTPGGEPGSPNLFLVRKATDSTVVPEVICLD